jgi:hypothetical protein
LGSHTACDFPMNLRVFSSLRGRCFPHKKQDMVAPPGLDAVRNGEPPTLDLYRSPSSRILVLSVGLLIPRFYVVAGPNSAFPYRNRTVRHPCYYGLTVDQNRKGPSTCKLYRLPPVLTLHLGTPATAIGNLPAFAFALGDARASAPQREALSFRREDGAAAFAGWKWRESVVKTLQLGAQQPAPSFGRLYMAL